MKCTSKCWFFFNFGLLFLIFVKLNTVISILDYVEYFKYKLKRACEIEKDNLKQNQDKKKQWYDKDVMIRKFKSGEKVIVLLLIFWSLSNCLGKIAIRKIYVSLTCTNTYMPCIHSFESCKNTSWLWNILNVTTIL
jgi:hypothetical protein